MCGIQENPQTETIRHTHHTHGRRVASRSLHRQEHLAVGGLRLLALCQPPALLQHVPLPGPVCGEILPMEQFLPLHCPPACQLATWPCSGWRRSSGVGIIDIGCHQKICGKFLEKLRESAEIAGNLLKNCGKLQKSQKIAEFCRKIVDIRVLQDPAVSLCEVACSKARVRGRLLGLGLA